MAVLTHAPAVTEYVINAVPALTPETRPVEAPTVATAGAEPVQVPPLVVPVHTAEEPTHKGEVPVIVCDIGAFMVTAFVAVLTQAPVVTE